MEHRLSDLGRIGEVRQARVVDGDAGGRQALRELVLEGGRDLLDIAAQRDGIHGVRAVLGVVVGIDARYVTERRFGLRCHELLVVVHVEEGLGGIGHVPNDHVGDFDGVAHLVVDLQDVAVERARTETLVERPLAALAAVSMLLLSESPLLPTALATASSVAELEPILRL